MSLNDDAVDDLNNKTLIDDNIVKPPTDIKLTNSNTTIVPESDVIKNSGKVVSNDDINDMLKGSIHIKTMDDGVEKVIDLKEIEKEFVAAESISQTSASYYDDFFEGILKTISLEQFTKTPSKTNYNRVASVIRSAIESNEDQIQNHFKNVIMRSFVDGNKVLQQLHSNYIVDFMFGMREMKSLAEKVLADISGNKNTIVPYVNGEHIEFINIAELDLIKLDFNCLQLKNDSIAVLSMYKQAIESIIKNSDVKTLLVLANEAEVVSYPVSQEFMMHVHNVNINLLYLAKFFNSALLDDYINSLGPSIDSLLVINKQIAEDIQNLTDYAQIEKYWLDQSVTLHDAHEKTLRIVSDINNVSSLAYNVKALFLYLSAIACPKA